MLESIGALASKAISAVFGRLFDWALGVLQRPSIRLQRAPQNLFDRIAPGTSMARAIELLGKAHHVHSHWHSFRFSDALVQISSEDARSVDWIGVVLPAVGWRRRFSVSLAGMGSLVLGKATLADALKLDPEAAIKKDYSTKHWCIWIESYYGFSGMYRHYLFGVMEAPGVWTPAFEWDHANDRLKSDPGDVQLNWIAVARSSGAAQAFNFWAFV